MSDPTRQQRLEMFDAILKSAAEMTSDQREAWVKTNTAEMEHQDGENDGNKFPVCIDPFGQTQHAAWDPTGPASLREFTKQFTPPNP